MLWGNKMVKFKNFNEENMADYTLENLKSFVGEIEMMKSVIHEKISAEIAQELKKDSFDIYSRRGINKVKKITKKYAGQLAGAESYLEIIGSEIKKREQYEEELRYSGRSVKKQKTVSTEEFLQKEQDKTWAYRSKIE